MTGAEAHGCSGLRAEIGSGAGHQRWSTLVAKRPIMKDATVTSVREDLRLGQAGGRQTRRGEEEWAEEAGSVLLMEDIRLS